MGQPRNKTAKAVLLDHDLVALLDAHERLTGATFQRTILAALAQYFLVHPSGPDYRFNQAAVALDKGTMAPDQVALKLALDVLDYATSREAELSRWPNEEPILQRSLDRARDQVVDAKMVVDAWAKLGALQEQASGTLGVPRSHTGAC